MPHRIDGRAGPHLFHPPLRFAHRSCATEFGKTENHERRRLEVRGSHSYVGPFRAGVEGTFRKPGRTAGAGGFRPGLLLGASLAVPLANRLLNGAPVVLRREWRDPDAWRDPDGGSPLRGFPPVVCFRPGGLWMPGTRGCTVAATPAAQPHDARRSASGPPRRTWMLAPVPPHCTSGRLSTAMPSRFHAQSQSTPGCRPTARRPCSPEACRTPPLRIFPI